MDGVSPVHHISLYSNHSLLTGSSSAPMNTGGHKQCTIGVHAVTNHIVLFINFDKAQGQHIRTRKRCARGLNRGERRSGTDFSSYALVFPRFRPRTSVSVSSCKSAGSRPGAGISESFPCAAVFCMNVSHMTSFIPLARASCVFNRATSSSSSVVRPSSRAASCPAACPCPGPDLGGGWTKNSQSRRSSSRGYAVTESCVVACRKSK
jgi:hypothetical protein